MAKRFDMDINLAIKEANRRMKAIEEYAKRLKQEGRIKGKKGYIKTISPSYTSALNAIKRFTGSGRRRRWVSYESIPESDKRAYRSYIRNFLSSQTSTPAGIADYKKSSVNKFKEWAGWDGDLDISDDELSTFLQIFNSREYSLLEKLANSDYVATIMVEAKEAGLSNNQIKEALDIAADYVKPGRSSDISSVDKFINKVVENAGEPDKIAEIFREFDIRRSRRE